MIYIELFKNKSGIVLDLFGMQKFINRIAYQVKFSYYNVLQKYKENEKLGRWILIITLIIHKAGIKKK